MNPEYEVRALALPPGKKDRRKIMVSFVYWCFLCSIITAIFCKEVNEHWFRIVRVLFILCSEAMGRQKEISLLLVIPGGKCHFLHKLNLFSALY